MPAGVLLVLLVCCQSVGGQWQAGRVMYSAGLLPGGVGGLCWCLAG